MSNTKNNFLREFLTCLQTILWCIDDTVDNSVSKELVAKNEITKFVMFYKAFRLLLEYQLNNKRDVINTLIGKPTVAERVLRAVEKNIERIVKIPESENRAAEKIRKAETTDEAFLATLECLLCRAAVIDLYADVIEAVEGVKLPKDELKVLRAVQLLREDFEDAEEDAKNGSVNVVLALKEKGMLERVVWEILKDVEGKISNELIRRRFEFEKRRVEDSVNY